MWEPSEASHRCSSCATHFTFFVRKHHCRACGKIFCDACSSSRVRIPSVMDACVVQSPKPNMISSAMRWVVSGGGSDGMMEQKQQQRVCRQCERNIVAVKDSRSIIDAIMLVKDVTISDWRTLRVLNSGWKVAMDTLLQTWRTTGYLPPYKRPSNSQRCLMRTNRAVISGHIAWLGINHPLLSSHPSRLNNGKGDHAASSCGVLGCRTSCESIPITIKRLAHMFLSNRIESLPAACDLGEMISAIASRAVIDAMVFDRIVLPLCSSADTSTAQKLFFQINGRSPDLASKIMQVAPASCVMRWRKIMLWIENMKCVAKWKDALHVEPEDWEGATLPLQPDVRVVEILHDAVTVKRSSTNPVVIPCVCENRKGSRFVQCYMMKEESVLPDATVQDLCAMIKLIARCERKSAMLITYDVLPLTRSTGMVTLVPGCTTLGRLRSEQQSITHYILENNPNENVKVLKGRFLGSCAATTAIATVLGVGDRHLDNLVLTRSAELFGVDYAYILGNEPLGKEILGNSLRLTPQVIEFLGGVDSATYSLFKNRAAAIYNLCRRYLNVLYPIMQSLVFDGITTDECLNAHIESAWLPSGDDISCKVHIENRIERVSRGSSSWKDAITDSLHSLWNS